MLLRSKLRFLSKASSILFIILGCQYLAYKMDNLNFDAKSEKYQQYYPSILNFNTFLKTKYYLLSIDKTILSENEVTSNQTQAIISNSRLGEALGFLTENTLTQKNLNHLFPDGIFDFNKLLNALINHRIIPPYGQYNNNYLTEDNRLIYSDDSDLASITYATIIHEPSKNINNQKLFSEELAQAFASHWLDMKKSGSYGIDGLYYGKRGYSKSMLIALRSMALKDKSKINWYLADKQIPDTLDNGPLLRAWVLGLDPRVTERDAFKLGYAQSLITSDNKDIALVSGAMAEVFKGLMIHKFRNKTQIVDALLQTIIKSNNTSHSIPFILLGRDLAARRIDPIIVFNRIDGFTYDKYLTLFIYSFLYFQDYKTALFYIVHTPGDNDSLAFVLGGYFSAYNHKTINPSYMNYLEPQVQWL